MWPFKRHKNITVFGHTSTTTTRAMTGTVTYSAVIKGVVSYWTIITSGGTVKSIKNDGNFGRGGFGTGKFGN